MNPSGLASALAAKHRSTLDRPRPRETLAEIRKWSVARNAEIDYATRLRQVGRQVGDFVRGFFGSAEPTAEAANAAAAHLHGYADVLRSWAEAVARRMLGDVERRNARIWNQHARSMSRNLAAEIATAPIGEVLRADLARQVDLITSLPREAAIRVQNLVLTGFVEGRRADDLAAEILKTGEVTVNRATLIARTETGRISTELTKARAKHVGSTHYMWRAVMDRDTRRRHRELNGTIHRWDDPPIASELGQNEQRYHPGSGPNCRCFAQPILADLVL
jgi:SPP1 gp7 family putative phage head morphogenesis protein